MSNHTVQTDFSDNGKVVNVTLHKNHLMDDDSSFAKVKRNTANAANLIAVIKEMSSSKIDEGYLMYCAGLFKKAALMKLKQGEAVNIFDLGTIYRTACGSIKGSDPSASDVPEFSVGFTPSDLAKEAVKDITVNVAVKEETHPVINTVTDFATGQETHALTPGSAVSIKGERLRIAGESDTIGFYFAPETENGSYDMTNAVKVPVLVKNFPTELSFMLPAGLQEGKSYYLVIKTASGKGAKVNKTIRTGVSSFTVTVGSSSSSD